MAPIMSRLYYACKIMASWRAKRGKKRAKWGLWWSNPKDNQWNRFYWYGQKAIPDTPIMAILSIQNDGIMRGKKGVKGGLWWSKPKANWWNRLFGSKYILGVTPTVKRDKKNIFLVAPLWVRVLYGAKKGLCHWGRACNFFGNYMDHMAPLKGENALFTASWLTNPQFDWTTLWKLIDGGGRYNFFGFFYCR